MYYFFNAWIKLEMRAILFSFAEGHAYKEEAYGTVSGTKSEISNFG